MKRIIAFIFAVMAVLMLAACGKNDIGKTNLPDEISIRQDAEPRVPDDTKSAENEAVEDPIADTPVETEPSPDTQSADGISPEFKKAMDSYEEFFDEYVEFMKEFNNSSDTVGMLTDYISMLTKYEKTMNALDEIDEDSLSAAEATYYTEVMARISKKLLSVTG